MMFLFFIFQCYILIVNSNESIKHNSKRSTPQINQKDTSKTATEFEVKGSVVGEGFHNTFGGAEENSVLWNDIHADIEKCTQFTEIDLADNIGGTANFYTSTPNYNVSFKLMQNQMILIFIIIYILTKL